MSRISNLESYVDDDNVFLNSTQVIQFQNI